MIITIDGRRNGYSPEQCGSTFTVREMIDYLEENFDYDDEIYLCNDGGYTYGNISRSSFGEFDEDEYEYDDEDEYDESLQNRKFRRRK